MDRAVQLKRGISRQFSAGSMKLGGKFSFKRQSSMDPRSNNIRFSFGRQSSLDPIRRTPTKDEFTLPGNLDSTMQLLFLACKGDVQGVKDLLDDGIDVNSIDLDGRTALHIAACEGHVDVAQLLLSRKANIDARDRWGSTAAADAKYYGNVETYNILKARGAKVPGNYQVAKWNGTKVSVKILDKDSYSDPESINTFKHELTLLEKVRHPNVVQFVGAVTQNIPMMIVSEFHQRVSSLSHPNRLYVCARNILLDSGGQLKVAGFAVIRLSKISPNKARLARPVTIDRANLYIAPEIYRDDLFDRSVDVYSFGLILYEMMEGVQPFHPKAPEDAVKLMCVDDKRPPFKIKAKHYPPDLKELIEECWYPDSTVRPKFSEIIIRLDSIVGNCSKQGWWKETFKLPWK
ncbi:Ankyrin repeat-containing protein [Cynara cardunculus var. scolymus]|uniref:Ankyrin repeat-containing protein n=1 Tax=Cynara cardunculus var. scolymus TaxID=59895 RepID=A0A103Y0S9_CYNCS|nr:Ankyrin repeat-containing protein [Cynara cardunculus var. scolymus]